MLHLNEEKQRFLYKVKVGEVTGIEKSLKEYKIDEGQYLFLIHFSKKSGLLSIMETKKEKGDAQTQLRPCKNGKITFDEEISFGCTLFKDKKKQTFQPKTFNIFLEAIEQKSNKKKEVQKLEWNISTYVHEFGEEKTSEDKIKFKNGTVSLTITTINDEKGGDSDDEDSSKDKRKSKTGLTRMGSSSLIERKDSLSKIERKDSQKEIEKDTSFLELKNENLNLKIQFDNLKKEKEESNQNSNQKISQYEEKIRFLENQVLSTSSELNQRIETLEKELEKEKTKETNDQDQYEFIEKISSLQSQLSELNNANLQLKDQIQTLMKEKEELSKTQKSGSENNGQYQHEFIEKISSLESQITQLNNSNLELKDHIEILVKEKEELSNIQKYGSEKNDEKVKQLEEELQNVKMKYENRLTVIQLDFENEKKNSAQLNENIHNLNSENDDLKNKLSNQSSGSQMDSKKVQDLENDLKELNSQLLDQSQEYQTTISKKDDEINIYKSNLGAIERRTAQLDKQNSILKQESDEKNTIIKRLNEDHSKLLELTTQNEKEIKELKDEIENNNTLKDHLKEDIQKLENDLIDKTKEIQLLNDRLAESEGGSKDVQEILKKKNSDIDEANRKVLSLEKEVKSLSELNLILKNSIVEKDQTETKSNMIQTELENLKKIHQEQSEKSREEIQRLESNLKQIQDENLGLSNSLQGLTQAKDKELQENTILIKNLNDEKESLLTKLSESINKNKESEDRIIQLKKLTEHKLEEITNLMKDLDTERKNKMELIKDNEYKVKTLEERVKLLSSGNNALEEMKNSYENQQRDLQLENEKLKETVKKDQRELQDSKEKYQKEILEIQEQSQMNENKIKTKEEQISKSQKENESLKKENSELIDKMQKILNDSKGTLEILQEKMNQLKKESNQRFLIDHAILLGFIEFPDHLNAKMICSSIKYFKNEKKFLLDIINAYYEVTDKIQRDTKQIIYWIQNVIILFNLLKKEDLYKDSLKELTKINFTHIQFKRNNSIEVNETTFFKEFYIVLQQFYALLLKNILQNFEENKLNPKTILQIWTDLYNQLKTTLLDIDLIHHLFATSASQLDQAFLQKFYKEKSNIQQCINLKLNLSQLERFFIDRKIDSIKHPFFTHTKQAADICTLSLKKELLNDSSMQEAVCPNLSKTQICKVLQNYEFDNLKEEELKEMKELIKIGLRDETPEPEFQLEWKKGSGKVLFDSDSKYELTSELPEKMKKISFLN